MNSEGLGRGAQTWRKQAWTMDLVPSHSCTARGLTLPGPQSQRERRAGTVAQPAGLRLDPGRALCGARLTCDVLTPGVVQVRGQHVPHGEEEARPKAAATRRCARCSGGRRWRHRAQPALLPPLPLP